MGAGTAVRERLVTLRARLTPGERMVPGYLVVGTKRGGSTSLADWIAAHPQVGPCRLGKGTHYFDVNHGRGWAWYAAQFPRTSEGYRITGESSPYYMFHPLSAPWIARELPETKIVVCLRNPVERAWSHHSYEVTRGHETLGFEQALDAEPARLDGEEERLRSDAGADSSHWRYHAYLRRGHYDEQLAGLHGLFGSDRVLVVQSEALFADPTTEMARVHAFLGLDPHVDPARPPLNAGKGSGAMSPQTRARLETYFAPHNEALYRLPGVDFRWDSPAGSVSTERHASRQAGSGVA